MISLYPSLQTLPSHNHSSPFPLLRSHTTIHQPSCPDTIAAVNPSIHPSLAGAGIPYPPLTQSLYHSQAHVQHLSILKEHCSAMEIELAKVAAERDTLQCVVPITITN
jgi:hypothetical protein